MLLCLLLHHLIFLGHCKLEHSTFYCASMSFLLDDYKPYVRSQMLWMEVLVLFICRNLVQPVAGIG